VSRLAFLLVCLVMGGSADAAAPRACVSADPPNGIPVLPENGPKLLVREVDLKESDGTTTGMVKTYSETDPSGRTRSEQCFRYEIENLRQTIRNFYWELAGLFLDPMESQARRSRNRKQQVFDDPIDIDSRLNAFENSKGTTRAWADRVTGDTLAVNEAPTGPTLTRVAVAEINPGLIPLLREHGALDSPAATYTLTEEKQKTPEVHDSYSGPDFKIEVDSVAERVGRELAFRRRVHASGEAVQNAAFSMPALLALLSLKAQPDLLAVYKGVFWTVHGVQKQGICKREG
jgi:hypothetical protein